MRLQIDRAEVLRVPELMQEIPESIGMCSQILTYFLWFLDVVPTLSG